MNFYPLWTLYKSDMKTLIGLRFGRLTVMQYEGMRNHLAYWKCRCDCGNTKNVRAGHLKGGKINSCGCIVRTRKCVSVTSPLMYAVWRTMHARCYNPKNKAFRFYGARGIKVCERWSDIHNFLSDMGERPKGHSIERINNEGDYTPENCKWATPIEQGSNTRNSHVITIDGISKTVSQWAHVSSVSRRAIGMRLEKGWPERAAIFTPRQGRTCPESFSDWIKQGNDAIDDPGGNIIPSRVLSNHDQYDNERHPFS